MDGKSEMPGDAVIKSKDFDENIAMADVLVGGESVNSISYVLVVCHHHGFSNLTVLSLINVLSEEGWFVCHS